ncbi:hypothetical protein IP86_01255 [Rhodopseudomonas sp. AAP120]|nr:hypothetical protein IP86_01255 [Rhodopseudomonas sp. AAP120]
MLRTNDPEAFIEFDDFNILYLSEDLETLASGGFRFTFARSKATLLRRRMQQVRHENDVSAFLQS